MASTGGAFGNGRSGPRQPRSIVGFTSGCEGAGAAGASPWLWCANAVAAIPSLHSGVPMMVLLFSWPLVGARTRVLLVAYVVAMTFTLAYGGEHYVVDAVVGWAYAAVAVFGVARLLRPAPDRCSTSTTARRSRRAPA